MHGRRGWLPLPAIRAPRGSIEWGKRRGGLGDLMGGLTDGFDKEGGRNSKRGGTGVWPWRTERTKGTSRALTLEGKRRQAGRRRTAMAVGPIHKERRCFGRLPCDERWRRICGSRSQSSWWRQLVPAALQCAESRRSPMASSARLNIKGGDAR
jgi:hypothetical protein